MWCTCIVMFMHTLVGSTGHWKNKTVWYNVRGKTCPKACMTWLTKHMLIVVKLNYSWREFILDRISVGLFFSERIAVIRHAVILFWSNYHDQVMNQDAYVYWGVFASKYSELKSKGNCHYIHDKLFYIPNKWGIAQNWRNTAVLSDLKRINFIYM